MVSPEVVQARLKKLAECTRLLKKLSRSPKEEFIRDPLVHGNAERYLQLAIQCTLDIGNHFLSNLKLRAPNEYREIFIILAENKILPAELADRLASAAGLRNILVHDYLELDVERVHEFLRERLGDFEEFAKAIERRL